MEKEKLVEFLFKLFGLKYKEDKYSREIFGNQSITLSFTKGNTTIDKILNFNMYLKDDNISIALPVFGIVDSLAKEYKVRVIFENNRFKFTIKVEGYW